MDDCGDVADVAVVALDPLFVCETEVRMETVITNDGFRAGAGLRPAGPAAAAAGSAETKIESRLSIGVGTGLEIDSGRWRAKKVDVATSAGCM